MSTKLSPPRRLLVRGVNWLGDAIMTTPALQRLREALPNTHITLLTHEKLSGLWASHSCLDDLLHFAPDESVLSVAGRIRGGKFDAALILPNSPRSALESWLAGVPRRIGYARPWRNFCLTRRVADRPESVRMVKRSAEEIQKLVSHPREQIRRPEIVGRAHQIHEYLHLATALDANPEPLAPFIVVRPDELRTAAAQFGLAAPAEASPAALESPLFGLNAGAEYGPAKRWPVERFISVAAEIQARTNCRWLVFGGPNDESLGAEVAAGIVKSAAQRSPNSPPQVLNLAGKTSLRELCILLKLCKVLLTNDSGPMHVAAAVGTPVVVPFGSTSPELTGPGLPGSEAHKILRANAPCSPCFLRVCPIDLRCMTAIAENQVVDAVLTAAGQPTA